MINKQMKVLIEQERNTDPHAYEDIQRIWDREIEVLCFSLDDTISFLDSLEDENDMILVAEVWDDISEYWKSKELIECMERCMERFPNIRNSLEVDIRYARKAVENDI